MALGETKISTVIGHNLDLKRL